VEVLAMDFVGTNYSSFLLVEKRIFGKKWTREFSKQGNLTNPIGDKMNILLFIKLVPMWKITMWNVFQQTNSN